MGLAPNRCGNERFCTASSSTHSVGIGHSAVAADWRCKNYEAPVDSATSFAARFVVLIGYARVSTAEQSLDLQLDALRQAACDRVFQDRQSGAVTRRPGLDDTLSHLRAGDTLVVWKLDRLGRTVRQLVTFVEDLQGNGIAFRSLTDGIDTTTPAGRFFFHVMAALAEMERDLLRERTRAGLVAAKARGREGGRPPKLSDEQIAHAERLMTDPKVSHASIARSLGVDRSTLHRTLARKAPL